MTEDLLKIEIEHHWNEDYRSIFERINQSRSMEELLKHFKQFTTKVKSDGFSGQGLKTLIIIYFGAKVKHPVKNLIQALFNQLNDEEGGGALEIFCSELNKQITHYSSLPLNERYHFVSCLNEMSQNFPIAEKSVGLHLEILLPLLVASMSAYVELLRSEVSPSQKNEMSHRLHNCLQATIFCVKSRVSQATAINYREDQLKEIADICLHLLDCNSDISLDTRNICAILLVTHETKFAHTSEHMSIILNESEQPMKRLNLMFGVITVQPELGIGNFECFTRILEEIYHHNSIDSALIYAVSRLFTLITKKISLLRPNVFDAHLQSITQSTLAIAFLNLEYYVDTVRYLARDSLKHLVEIGMKINERVMINEIFNAITSSSSVSTKAIVINAIHSSLPIDEILQRLPNFQSSLLSSIGASKEHKMSCYEALSSKCYKESSLNEWFNFFIEPIVERIKSNQISDEEYALLKGLLLKCVKKNKSAIKMILLSSHDVDIGFHLLCLSMAKMEGALEDVASNEQLWKGVISFDEIKRYMVDIDADIRLAALQLIVDTKKSTECFSVWEIECILYFFTMNINVQSPLVRQNIVSMIKKIFTRLAGVIQYLLKRNESDDLGNQLEMLKKLHECCLENLAEGANFSRRSLSLHILCNVLMTMQTFFPSKISSLWHNAQFETLFNAFTDTFESNKEMVLEIMQYLPRSTLTTYSKVNLGHVEKLMSSIKPADSLTAAYLLQFSLKFNLLSPELTTTTDTSKWPDTYRLLIWCESLLLRALAVGEKSIIVAAGSNPMYGSLLCIRYIISKLDLCDLRTCPEWQNLFARLISICKRLSNVVGPIVNDSSPEGCIPKEENLAMVANGGGGDYFEKIIENTTPQMVLLCAWRTIKEVSLLLGDLSARAPLSVDQMMAINHHFIQLLTNTKHRGAFEQSYFGFSQFSVALRLNDNAALHSLPEKLLHDIITSLSGENHEKENDFMQIKNLCATRRSAGLPYIIQALLMSEIKTAQAKNFHFVMRNLIEFARRGVQLETRIHSLNILRALFRCKEFNDVIGEYISPALQCSLLGYGAHSWAEKNSSTLLFSALMIRIFGVQRNKNSDDINIKNRMSGRVFFLRYPELYEFFMAQLIEAIEHVKEQKMNSKLHPLMLLLNRLYTSIADNSESNFKLIDFIPLVAICSSCVEFQTRELCAKFIANVIQPCHLLSRISENIAVLRENENLKGNSKHARIIEIFYLVRAAPIEAGQVNDLVDVLNEILSLLKSFDNELICFGSLLDVIIEVFQKIHTHLPNERINMDGLVSCFNFTKSALLGFPLLHSKIAAINLLMGELDFVLSISTSMNSCELLEKLNCMILLLNRGNAADLAEEYEITPKVYFIIENLSRDLIKEFELKINSDSCLISELRKMANSKDANLAARSYEVLSSISMKIDSGSIARLMNGEMEEKPEVMKKSILKYVSMCIRRESTLISDITDWRFLSRLIIDSQSFFVKSATIDILKAILMNNSSDAQSQKALFAAIKCIVLLLLDDDFEIRQKTSSVVSELLRLRQVFMGTYAQEVFLRHLLRQTAIDRDKVIGTIIILMYEEETATNNEDEKSNHIACEFQVFDKNETGAAFESRFR